MLFCSYAQGKAFMAPLTKVIESLTTVYSIQVSQLHKPYGDGIMMIIIIFSFSFAVAEV